MILNHITINLYQNKIIKKYLSIIHISLLYFFISIKFQIKCLVPTGTDINWFEFINVIIFYIQWEEYLQRFAHVLN